MSHAEDYLVKTLVQWLRSEKDGHCLFSEIGTFYRDHPQFTGPRPRLEALCKRYAKHLTCSQKGKKVIKCARMTLQSPAELWVHIPSISSEVIAKFKENASIDIHTVFETTNSLLYALLKQRKLGSNRANVEKLRCDKDLREALLSGDKSLRQMSSELAITTTDICIELLGWEFIDANKLNNDLQSTDRKESLLQEGRELAKFDQFVGYKLCAANQDIMRATSTKKEGQLMALLQEKLGLFPSDFVTEEQIRATAVEGQPHPATPDILLKESAALMINGVLCRWIEVKHSVVVPGLSAFRQVLDIKIQTDRYVNQYGPGMILWSKHGYTAEMVAALSTSIVHGTPTDLHDKTLRLATSVVEQTMMPYKRQFHPPAMVDVPRREAASIAPMLATLASISAGSVATHLPLAWELHGSNMETISVYNGWAPCWNGQPQMWAPYPMLGAGGHQQGMIWLPPYPYHHQYQHPDPDESATGEWNYAGGC